MQRLFLNTLLAEYVPTLITLSKGKGRNRGRIIFANYSCVIALYSRLGITSIITCICFVISNICHYYVVTKKISKLFYNKEVTLHTSN